MVESKFFLHPKSDIRGGIHSSDGNNAIQCPADHPLVHELLFVFQDRGAAIGAVTDNSKGSCVFFDSGDYKLPDAIGGSHFLTQIKYFTAFKRYFSYTKYEASFILYYTVFYVLNSCCVVYIVH